MNKEKISIIWFKKDIRFEDHKCLDLCSKLSISDKNFKVLLLYIDEKEYWMSDKASLDQRHFVYGGINSLNKKLKKRGINNKVYVIHNAESTDDALQQIINCYDVSTVFSHRETGNGWTFSRDKKIKKLLEQQNIQFLELKQDCLLRGLSSTKDSREFSKRYTQFFSQTPHKNPTKLNPPTWIPPWLVKQDLDYQTEGEKNNLTIGSCIQRGGEDLGQEVLNTFFYNRCLTNRGYRSEMSNPLIGRLACSRISAHLSMGSLSHRLVYQKACKELEALSPNDRKAKQIQSFLTRLAWRSHFMQKFETLYWMEYKCLNPRLENLHGWNQEDFQRWKDGLTGYPFVDACMRSLNKTKWLNFRARALVVSFASYALNLDWRGFGPHLASNFLDYEPGIHYSQLQMQGGTTVSSPTRIYNPLKQSVEKDPKGDFIRLWVPELRGITTSLIHLPCDNSRNGYPAAIVPMNKLWAVMRNNAPKKQKREIVSHKTFPKNQLLIQRELFT
jgi:deoxyribodipyrimidine photo-lyase